MTAVMVDWAPPGRVVVWRKTLVWEPWEAAAAEDLEAEAAAAEDEAASADDSAAA